MSDVRLEGVSRYFGSVKAVDHVDLEVADGEFVTLLGPSGCGKTTTLRMIAGLERNTTGTIRLGGETVSDAGSNRFILPERRNLGMVFQSYAIWPHMTVFENVAYPLKVRKLAKAEIAVRVGAALQLVEMAHLAERDSTALSGGQQQRVAIARALVFEPGVLLLDEPLSNLDAKLRAQMGDEFRALQRRLNVTTIYVTHDQDEAMALSDRIVVMEGGRVLQIGSAEEIYHRPNGPTVARFIGSPNLFPGRVTGLAASGDGLYELRVACDGWEAVCGASEPIAPGEAVMVMVRPESLRLANGHARADDVAITMTGRVAGATFRGALRSVLVAMTGSTIQFDTPSLAPIESGETVTLEVPKGAAWAMRARASA